MVFIYVLELSDNKYYVGKTAEMHFSLDLCCDLNMLEWTKKYKPLKIIECISNCDDGDEDKYIIKYMSQLTIFAMM